MELYYYVFSCNNCFTSFEEFRYFDPITCDKCDSEELVIIKKEKPFD